MSLAQVSNGDRVTIVSLNMTESGALRLYAMGLVPGTQIRVIDNSLAETSLIECRGTRLAIGRGLPRRIEVR